MHFKKVDARALLVWRIRLCLYALIPSFLTALFFSPESLVWLILTAAWILAFLTMFLWYYPLKFRKLSYAVGEELLVIHTGVIYTRRKSMLLSNIQYVNVATYPLPRLFGLCSLYIQAAGGMLNLPGVRLEDGLLLQRMLTPGVGGEL